MNLKFIGEDGSMGLKHGAVYDLNVFVNHTHVCVEWFDGNEFRQCPYSSPASFAANWAKPGLHQKVVVRKKSKTVDPVKHGRWRIETDEEEPNIMFKFVACSTCNRKTNMKYAYCPHCGAKMDGGNNENG